jgi:Ala-tRNA(Pro) deacylase
MATMNWIKDLLEKRGVPFEERHHRVAFTAQEVAQSEHITGHRVAKVVIVIADGRPVELILPASRRIVLDQVGKLLAAREVRLASEAEMDRVFIDCGTGAIPPLRHWKDVEVVMDASMPREGEVIFQGGTHEDAVRLAIEDWLPLVNPRIGLFTMAEHAPSVAFEGRGDVGGGEWAGPAEEKAEEARRESGVPGGGKGRIDVLEMTGVYPGSGPYPPGSAVVRTPGDFVHGQRDEQGREVEGGSELIYFADRVLLGGETPPPSGPPRSSDERSKDGR